LKKRPHSLHVILPKQPQFSGSVYGNRTSTNREKRLGNGEHKRLRFIDWWRMGKP